MQCDESKKDWERCYDDAQIHQSSALAIEISSSTAWPKLWDMALIRSWDCTLHCRHSSSS